MPENWCLNGFYPLPEMTGLYDAIPLRESCRCFVSAPSTEQWAALQTAAGAYALPGSRLVLGMCDNGLFKPFGGLLMKFENVQRFAAVLTTEDTTLNSVNAGISGEMLMLEAVKMGLAGVWVAGTYKHSKVDVELRPGEEIKALIALGVPRQPPVPPLARKRKELSQICSDNFAQAPGCFRDVALAVRVAPSAMNLQPWLLTYLPENRMTIGIKRPMQGLDLGIAVCHGALAMGNTPVTFALSQDGLTATFTC